MKKKFKLNEKGVTLIEVLGVLLISAVVFGVISMIFMSINLEWNSTTNKYNDDTAARNTMNILTTHLSDSVRVCVRGDTLIMEKADGDIKGVRYESNGNLYMENAPASAISSCAYATGTHPMLLASHLKEAPKLNGMTDASYSNGASFQLTLTFNYTRFTVNGKSTPREQQYTTTIKLFKEPQ